MASLKYQLIKCYPGSPELGTILEEGYAGYVPDGQSKSLGSWFVNKNHVENNPEFWKPIREEIKLKAEDILHLVEIKTFRWGNLGGQHVNMNDSAVRLTCEDFKLVIDCGQYKSQYRNKEECLKLFQLFLDNLDESVKQYYYKSHGQR